MVVSDNILIPYYYGISNYNPWLLYDVILYNYQYSFPELTTQLPCLNLQITPKIGYYDPTVVSIVVNSFMIISSNENDMRKMFLTEMAIYDYSFRHFGSIIDNPEVRSNLIDRAAVLADKWTEANQGNKPCNISWNPFLCWLNELIEYIY
jgi:hypothetical protein